MTRDAGRTGILLLTLSLAGCGGDEPVNAVDAPPAVGIFAASKTTAVVGEPIVFQLDATDDMGLDSAVVAYGDSARTLLLLRGRKHLSASASRYYAAAGEYLATLTVYDTRAQSDLWSIAITVTSP